MYSEEAKQRLGHVDTDTEWVRVTVDPSVGCRFDGMNCPVFHALDDAGFPIHAVDGNYAHWLGGRTSSKLPLWATKFVRRFDVGLRAGPIELLVNSRTFEIKDV